MKTFLQFITEEKTNYIGKYNWYGELHTLYCSAYSKEQAHKLFCDQLAKKVKRTSSSVKNYFSKPNSYSIQEIK